MEITITSDMICTATITLSDDTPVERLLVAATDAVRDAVFAPDWDSRQHERIESVRIDGLLAYEGCGEQCVPLSSRELTAEDREALSEVINTLHEQYVPFTRRTNQPKLGWLMDQLQHRGIASKIDGESFHAPILKVARKDLDAANAILDPVDDVPDDDLQFAAFAVDCGSAQELEAGDLGAEIRTMGDDRWLVITADGKSFPYMPLPDLPEDVLETVLGKLNA